MLLLLDDNCDTNLFVRQSTIEMEGEEVKYGDLRENDNTSDFVEGYGQQGDQAACTYYVNIPGLHQRLCSLDTTHVLVALAIIACFMLFKIS